MTGGPNRTAPLRALAECPWLAECHPDSSLLSARAYARVKRALDLTIVLAALPVALVVLAGCALALKLESPRSPVLFRQPRTGRGGRIFVMYKLRTMVEDADKLQAALAHLSELPWPDFKMRDDPRITRVGRYLRRTSLDELPQLFNVLSGDMSLVGPRPTHVSTGSYVLWQTERLDAKPGLTGLWQVLARAEVDFADRSRLDIAYTRRQCLMLDLQILLRTVPAVLRGAKKGAT